MAAQLAAQPRHESKRSFALLVFVCGVCVCVFPCFASVRGFFTIPP